MAKLPVEFRKSLPAADYWHDLRSEMDKLFDRFTEGFELPAWRGMGRIVPTWPFGSSGTAAPAVDFAEDAKGYTVTVELPGLDQKDVNVSVTGNALVIEGEKQQESEQKGKNHYLAERSYGMFQRSFVLPEDVKRQEIGASFAKGVLTVTLPKTAEAQKQQKIEVKAA